MCNFSPGTNAPRRRFCGAGGRKADKFALTCGIGAPFTGFRGENGGVPGGRNFHSALFPSCKLPNTAARKQRPAKRRRSDDQPGARLKKRPAAAPFGHAAPQTQTVQKQGYRHGRFIFFPLSPVRARMCGITICSRHIYNRISYTRTRAERRAAKKNACACVHIRKRTYVAAARRRGFYGQPPGREESVSAFERVSERRRIPFLPTRGRAQGSPRAPPAQFILIPS